METNNNDSHELLQMSKNLEVSIRTGDVETAQALVRNLALLKASLTINPDGEIASSGKKIKLRIQFEGKVLSGPYLEIHIDPQTTIGALKIKIFEKLKFLPEVQCCIVGKRIRCNTETLAACGLTFDGCIMFMYILSADKVVLNKVGNARKELPAQGLEKITNSVTEGNDRFNVAEANLAPVSPELMLLAFQAPIPAPILPPVPQAAAAPEVTRDAEIVCLTQDKPANSNQQKASATVTLATDAETVLKETEQPQPKAAAGRNRRKASATVTLATDAETVLKETKQPQPKAAAGRNRRKASATITLATATAATDVLNEPELETGTIKRRRESSSPIMVDNLGINNNAIPTGFEQNSQEENQWSCSSCTYFNHPAILECELCGTQREGASEARVEGVQILEYEDYHLLNGVDDDRLASELEVARLKNYNDLLLIDQSHIIKNSEPFQCTICLEDCEPAKGVVLRECLHMFCCQCLEDLVRHSENPVVKCPFNNGVYQCQSELLDREIKALVPAELYQKHLQRSLVLAECQAQNSYHCVTPNCIGWCIYEDEVNTFYCYVCKHWNCLTCRAIHEGMDCVEHQRRMKAKFRTDFASRMAEATLDELLKYGEAMKCPTCGIIIMKKDGCDWIKCTMCQTEICWVTRQARWGRKGVGDTSGGCRCRVNGKACHPDCQNCH